MNQILQRLVTALRGQQNERDQSTLDRAALLGAASNQLTQKELLLIVGASDDPYAGPRGGWLV
jgi:hypothetical protein